MAQRKPEDKSALAQVLKLVEQLSPEELYTLRRKLDAKAWAKEWRDLAAEVDEQSSQQPPITEEEIMAEMRAVKEEMRARRAENCD